MTEPRTAALTAEGFWATACAHCAHPVHPLKRCSVSVGGDYTNGPEYCPCTIDFGVMEGLIVSLQAQLREAEAASLDSDELRRALDHALTHSTFRNCFRCVQAEALLSRRGQGRGSPR